MHTLIKTLQKISTKYAPSRNLSFDIVHIFKTLQLAEINGHISRSILCKELDLGEGSVKTLIKHLKMNNIIITSNSGTVLTEKGKKILHDILLIIPSETKLPKSSITLAKFNYSVLMKNLGNIIGSGIEQRDAAIRLGARGATTLIFDGKNFLIPGTDYDTLSKEPVIKKLLLKRLRPEINDVIIIGSDDHDEKIAELATKNAAILTIMDHTDH